MDYCETKKLLGYSTAIFDCDGELGFHFLEYLKQKIKQNKGNIVFLCIGTNRIIGDSVGPRIGSILKQKIKNEEIIGDVLKPLTYNRIFNIRFRRYLKNKFIVTIDSSIGPKNLIGKIFVTENKLEFGKAVYKKSFSVGNIAIKACVCENVYNKNKNYLNLKKVDINLVEDLSQKIVNYIEKIYE